MLKKTRFYTHTEALTALFVLGQAEIFINSKNTVLGFLTAFLSGVAVIAVSSFITKKASNIKNAPLKKTVCTILLFSVCVYSAFCFSKAFLFFLKFSKAIILKEASYFSLGIIFSAVLLYFSFKRQEDILKFSIIAIWGVLGITVIFAVLLFPSFNAENLVILPFDLNGIGETASHYLKSAFLPCVLLGFYENEVFGKAKTGALIKGLLLGGALLGFCVICPILIFGNVFSQISEYPFSLAISTVQFGKLFSRLDMLSFLMLFISALIKCAVCLFLSFASLKRMSKILKSQ